LIVIEQHFQKMIGREPLMAFTQGQRLRRLDEPPRPLGVFLEIHGQPPRPRVRISSGPREAPAPEYSTVQPGIWVLRENHASILTGETLPPSRRCLSSPVMDSVRGEVFRIFVGRLAVVGGGLLFFGAFSLALGPRPA